MLTKAKFLFKLSRPRFWMYLAGPYLIGYSFAANGVWDFVNPLFIATFIFFLIPANIFLYGINDFNDSDTDSINIKKKTKEVVVDKRQENIVKKSVIASALIALLLFIYSPNNQARSMLAAFIFLSYFYSAKPLRFKKRLFWDSASNVLYALPAFFGFASVANISLIPWQVVIAAFLWTFSMHFFSAIVDIAPDKRAGIKTTAVVLGYNRSLAAVTILWTLMCLVVLSIPIPVLSKVLAFIYPLIPITIKLTKADISKVYWYFPIINTAAGFVLFVFAAGRFIFH